MPGHHWSRRQLAALKKLRRAGVSVTQIVTDKLLNGRRRSADSIRQQLKRQGWVDPAASQRAKNRVEFNGEQHAIFVKYLRQYSTAPVEQLSRTWNNWASERNWPKAELSTVWYWIEKLKLPHSRKDTFQSDWAKKKRKERTRLHFISRMESFEVECELELAALKQTAKSKDFRKLKTECCGCCGNRWPLVNKFFSRLPAIHGIGGVTIDELQTEFCQYCDWMFSKKIALLRYYKADFFEFVAKRKEQRRKGIDKAFERQLEAARKDCAKHKGERRPCIRCKIKWPLDNSHFHPNRGKSDGQPTYRALCVFCDHHFNVQIDRLRRDKKSYEHVIAERDELLFQARTELRNQRRILARESRRALKRSLVGYRDKPCETCNERWPINAHLAHRFWYVSRYRSRVTHEMHSCLSGKCIFCVSDEEAGKRRKKKVL